MPPPENPCVLFFIRSLETGGAERQLVVLANRLADLGWDISIVTYYSGGELEALVSPQIKMYDLGKTSRWHLLGPIARYFLLLRRIRPQVVHAYMDSANLLAALIRPLSHKHSVIWGIRTSDMRDGPRDLLQKLLFELEIRMSTAADLIILNSRTGLEFATSHGMDECRCITIRNGIDTEKFRPDPIAGQTLRRKLRIGANIPVVSIVARLHESKGHEVLLKAFAALLDKSVHLIVAGSGTIQMLQKLKTTARRLGISSRVHFLGNVTDIMAVYNASDVNVLASTYGEGTPNAPAEAMACGTPNVVVDLGDAAFVVGDKGRVVPANDIPAMTAAITDLLSQIENDPELGVQARTRIVEELSISKLVTDTRQAIEAVLDT